ncbi:hypothetical protein B0H14DRAFT_3501461 [Mycena olivaceomarginata]|nr:hypothetical protein B0H14DRAFT_3501461 [Mycena olivaceomarginata]
MQVPYTGGTHVVKPEDLVVYYDVDEEKHPRLVLVLPPTFLSPIDLFFAAATFGMDQAGKMDLAKFAARLDVVASGLVDAISLDILQGQTTDGDKVLRAELYKLNVYGPRSFFKATKILLAVTR